MAEENKSQSKGIGELFVEFGAKGVPGLLKNLNSVSASFLLGKNAATQFAQTLTKPLKEAGKGAVEVGKLSNALDTSYKNVQKLQYYLKSKNVSEGLIGDLGNIQTTLRDVFSGFKEVPGEFALAFAQTGHLLEDYTDDFDNILQLVKDIQNADLTRSQRNQIFDFLGMSRDWGYLFSRGDFNLNDALALPDDVIEKNIKTAENIAEFGNALEQLKNLLVAEFLPPLTDFVKWFTGATNDIISKNKSRNEITDNISKGLENNAGKLGVATAVATGNVGVGTVVVGAGNLAREQRSLGGKTGHIVPQQFGAAPLDFGIAPWHKNKGTPTGGAAPLPDFMDTAAIPTGADSIVQNITISNSNTINGTNATEIANEIAAINAQQIQYNQYQISNMAGN